MTLGKVGVILSGGGYVGAFQVGALQSLWERKIIPQKIQGISVGALNGAKVIESGPSLLKEVWLAIEKQGPGFVFSSFRAFYHIASGQNALFSDQGLSLLTNQMKIPEILKSPIDFEVVVRNESKGRLEIISNSQYRDDSEKSDNQELFRKFLKASASLPGFLPPVLINGDVYSDGYYFIPRRFSDFDTLFILLCDQPNSDERFDCLNWRRRLMNGFGFVLDECMEEKIKTFIEKHHFQLFPEEECNWQVGKHIQEIFKEFFKSLVGLPTKKLIIISPSISIPSLTISDFQKGDISKIISHGFEKTSEILNKLDS